MAKKFIKKALSQPGDKGRLHRALGVPQDQPIGKSRLASAARRPGRVGREARFAQTLGNLRHKKSKMRPSY